MKTRIIVPLVFAVVCIAGCGSAGRAQRAPSSAVWDPFLDTLEERTIRFFLETTDARTGLALDRWPTPSPSSVAAVGFALTVNGVAAERGIVTRAAAAVRTRDALRALLALRQGADAEGTAGYRGLFYHFLTLDGRREWRCELSSIDTGLLMAGVLFAQSYFDGGDAVERDIRRVADSLYRRTEWDWMMNGTAGIALGWHPGRGFESSSWHGYNEAMILYILALGSPTHPVPASVWEYWTSTYVWADYFGHSFVSFGPLFGHQFSHCWIDFRGIRDAYMRSRGIDYFENSRRATLSQQAYAKANPLGMRGYGENIWGFSACDGPKDTTYAVDGRRIHFEWYGARGVSVDWVHDDGTITPEAPAGSLPFAPEICVAALRSMRDTYDTLLFRAYGFVDAFNPSYVAPGPLHTGVVTDRGWFARDHLGIDQGPIVLMIENLRSDFVWRVMRKNPYVVAGLKRAGFTGGWLEQ